MKTAKAFSSALVLCFLFHSSVNAAGNMEYKDDSLSKTPATPQKNYLKFAPLSFIPFHLMPCFEVDYERVHNPFVSSQLNAGLFIGSNPLLHRFPGYKIGYELRTFPVNNEMYKCYLGLNVSYMMQNGILSYAASEFTDSTNTHYTENADIHRNVMMYTGKLGFEFNVTRNLAFDAYLGGGIITGSNVYSNAKAPEAYERYIAANPFALTLQNGSFSSPTLLCNIKICYSF